MPIRVERICLRKLIKHTKFYLKKAQKDNMMSQEIPHPIILNQILIISIQEEIIIKIRILIEVIKDRKDGMIKDIGKE